MLMQPSLMAAAEKEASLWGASISLDRGSKHLMIVVHFGEQKRKFTVEARKKEKSKQKADARTFDAS